MTTTPQEESFSLNCSECSGVFNHAETCPRGAVVIVRGLIQDQGPDGVVDAVLTWAREKRTQHPDSRWLRNVVHHLSETQKWLSRSAGY